MHKIAKTAVALAVGVALALGIPVAASATPLAPASSTVSLHSATASLIQGHSNGGYNDKGYGNPKGHHKAPHKVIHKKPHPTKPAYPPTKPPKHPKPPFFPHPFYWGGFWWFPFFFPAHTFHPGSIVHISFTGFGGFSFFGQFQASESGNLVLGTAAADGSLNGQLKASGSTDLAGQTLNATVTDNAGTSVTQTVTVPADSAKSAAAATSSVKSVDPGSLASTGTYISLATVWGAVGLVALGAAFVTMRSVVRRKDRAKV